MKVLFERRPLLRGQTWFQRFASLLLGR